MLTFANATTMANSAGITVTWVTTPEGPPCDDPPAGVPARPGPRPGAPPMLAAVDERCAVAA
jgi:hypothetical protein